MGSCCRRGRRALHPRGCSRSAERRCARRSSSGEVPRAAGKIALFVPIGPTAIRTRDLSICSRPPYRLATEPKVNMNLRFRIYLRLSLPRSLAVCAKAIACRVDSPRREPPCSRRITGSELARGTRLDHRVQQVAAASVRRAARETDAQRPLDQHAAARRRGSSECDS